MTFAIAKKHFGSSVALVLAAHSCIVLSVTDEHVSDSRSIYNGTTMVTDGYLDQPYCAVYPTSGRWLCTITGSKGTEGSKGEHVMSIYSDDAGQTWSYPISVEPPPLNTELANAYSMTVIAEGVTPGGGDRAYAIYSMNVNNITSFPGKPAGSISRVDMMGVYVMRYSDDQGQSWSSKQYKVPFRLTSIDKNNDWHGSTTIMWTVDTVKSRDGSVYFGFTKIGHYLLGPPEEMWILSSPNLLSAKDPSQITWRLLPDGDVGIKPVGGQETTNIEEAHILPLKNAGYPGFYLFGRTTTGWLVESHTADKEGATGWSPTAYAQYYDPTLSPKKLVPLAASSSKFGGNVAGIKNPRGPTMAKLMHNSQYLLLFYNNFKTGFTDSRNPYWLAAGYEVPGQGTQPPTVLWSQPEIAIYDGIDKDCKPGYPDFIEWRNNDGEYDVYITETQKSISRIHKVDRKLLAELFNQANASDLVRTYAVDIQGHATHVVTPQFPNFPDSALPAPTTGTTPQLGFSISALLSSHSEAKNGDIILSSLSTSKENVAVVNGVVVSVGENGTITLQFGDGTTSGTLSTDPVCTAALNSPGTHYWGTVVDGGASIITMFVDGVLCDGGSKELQGWAWFDPISGSIRGSSTMQVTPSYGGSLERTLMYMHRLSTSEMIGNYRSLMQVA